MNPGPASHIKHPLSGPQTSHAPPPHASKEHYLVKRIADYLDVHLIKVLL